ncbi:hypothetical protein ACLEUK_22585 [Pseudescherichia vulneris]
MTAIISRSRNPWPLRCSLRGGRGLAGCGLAKPASAFRALGSTAA